MTLSKIIYLAGLAGRVQHIILWVLGFLVIKILYCFFTAMVEHDYGDKESYYFGEIKKYTKLALVVALLVAVIPSKWEMFSMTITKGYKVENIYQMTKDELRDNINYFVKSLEKMESMKND